MATNTTITIPDSRDGRVLEFFGSADAMNVIQEAVGNDQFFQAIGYLSSWGMNYPKATLYFNARDMEITATYYNQAGDMQYCIGGIFNADTKKFSFHS